MKNFSLLLFLLFQFSVSLSGQVTLNPALPSITDSVTVIFDATKGNANLQGYTGNVYMYTGLITSQSTSGSDWKNVVPASWGDLTYQMTNIAPNIYQFKMVIQNFYNVQPGENVLQLAFLFYNAGATLSGRAIGNGNIYAPIQSFRNDTNNLLSYQLQNDTLYMNTKRGTVTLQTISPTICKVSFYPVDSIIKPDTSLVVLPQTSSITPNVTETDSTLIISTSALQVIAKKSPFALSYIYNSDTLLKEENGFEQSDSSILLRFYLDNTEHIYGTGSRAIPFDRRGYLLTSYNQADFGYGNNTPNMNINIPFAVSSKQYGIYFEDSYPATLDIGSTQQNIFQYTAENGKLAYYFIAGSSLGDVLNQYTNLTGKQPLPPRWALGYVQSKYGYQNTSEAASVVNSLQSENFPLDMIVLDLYWFGSAENMGNLNWDYSDWTNPVSMMSSFKSTGVKTMLIAEPYITTSSTNYASLVANNLIATNQSKQAYVLSDFWAGAAGLLDLTNPLAQTWMWSFYQARANEGVSAWWSDLGEPEEHPNDMIHYGGPARKVHNIFALEWEAMISNHYKTIYPQQRLYNLTRSGYAGMQRYNCFPWSGDIQSSFDGLTAQVPIMLGMGMSGVSYMTSDLGGFTGGASNELYTRWLQYGAFVPVMRTHGEGVTEPFNYPDPYKSIVRNYIQLRYRMLPYNYTLAWQNTTTGKPLALPLNYYDAGNSTFANVNDEYFWGDEILVAPVLEEGATSRNVIFPAGNWYNYFTNDIIAGNNTAQSVNVDINNIPVYVKAGSILPTSPLRYTTDNYTGDTLIIEYFANPGGSKDTSGFTMYDDDGASPQSLVNNNYELLQMNAANSTVTADYWLTQSGQSTSLPQTREIIVQFMGMTSNGVIPVILTLNGTPLTRVTTYDSMYLTPNTFFKDTGIATYAHFTFNGAPAHLYMETIQSNTAIKNAFGNSTGFKLHAPFPNPFIENTTIVFDAVQPGNYNLQIINILGQIVWEKNYSVVFSCSVETIWNGCENNGQELNGGIYFIELSFSGQNQMQKLILAK